MSIEIAEILDDAANYIIEHGWAQLTYETTDGRVCISEAIFKVYKPEKYRYNYPKIMNALSRIIPNLKSPGYLSDWNDMPGRTEQEVISMLRLAAKKELEQ